MPNKPLPQTEAEIIDFINEYGQGEFIFFFETMMLIRDYLMGKAEEGKLINLQFMPNLDRVQTFLAEAEELYYKCKRNIE